MSSGYYYDDGTPIEVELGAHGMQPEFEAVELPIMWNTEISMHGKNSYAPPLPTPDSAATTEIVRSILYDQYGAAPSAGEPFSLSRQTNESQKWSTLNGRSIAEFIFFGRSHRYLVESAGASADLFQKLAELWRQNASREGRTLLRSLQMDMEVLGAFILDGANLGGWMSAGINDVRRLWHHAPNPPTVEDYYQLMDRCVAANEAVVKSANIDYPGLHDVGIEFMRIRRSQERLRDKVMKHVAGMIESAQVGLSTAETVEEKSFAVLDLYGQIRFPKNPAGLAAYRIGVLTVRLGSRSLSDRYICDSEIDKVLDELRDGMLEKLPDILKDFLQAKMFSSPKLGLSTSRPPNAADAASKGLIKIGVFVAFSVPLWYFYKRTRKKDPVSGEAFGVEFATELLALTLSMVGNIIANGYLESLRESKDGEEREKLAETVIEIIAAVVEALFAELKKLQKTADDEHKTVWDIFVSDMGHSLIRLFTDIGWRMSQEFWSKKWMQKRRTGELKEQMTAKFKKLFPDLENGSGGKPSLLKSEDAKSLAVNIGASQTVAYPKGNDSVVDKGGGKSKPYSKSDRTVKITRAQVARREVDLAK